MKQLSFFLALTAAGCASAQLSAYERKALENHPMIKAAEAEADALRAMGSGLAAPFRPMISLTGVGAIGDDASIFATAFEPRNYLLAAPDPVGIGSLMAMWTIFSGGRDSTANAISRALAEEGRANIAVARNDVLLMVREAFAEYSVAQEILAARTAGVAAAKELFDVTEQRFAAGSAPEAFVLKARAEEAKAERLRALAEGEMRSKAARLREAAGLAQVEELTPGAWDIELAAPTSLEEALAQAEARPELVAAAARVRSLAGRARSVRQSSYPELNIVAMGTGMATDAETDVFYKAGLVLSIPIADGGMRRAESNEMAAMAKAAEQELRAARLRVEREVAEAWGLWQASPEAVAAGEAEAVAAQEAYRIARLRYSEGKAPQVEVEQAAADLVEAVSGRAEANAFRRIAWAKLMRAVGNYPDQEDQIK
jgi:outer membrane protein TolC